MSSRSAIARALRARIALHREVWHDFARDLHAADIGSGVSNPARFIAVTGVSPNPALFLAAIGNLLFDAMFIAHEVTRDGKKPEAATTADRMNSAHITSAEARAYLVPRGGIGKERARVQTLHRRQAERARPLPGKPRKTPHAWDNATTRGLADRVYRTLDPLDAAVLADALDEANLPAELAAPYRGEPETLTRADWLFWHLGSPGRVRLASELPP